MKAGFTGTSKGMSASQKSQLTNWLASLGITQFHHGDCVGADAEAHQISLDLDIDVVIHPPENGYMRAYCGGAIEVLPVKPFLDRNHDIVDATEVLFVGPRTMVEERRSGTWATWRYGKKTGTRVIMLER